jgi:hypothetical protein
MLPNCVKWNVTYDTRWKAIGRKGMTWDIASGNVPGWKVQGGLVATGCNVIDN